MAAPNDTEIVDDIPVGTRPANTPFERGMQIEPLSLNSPWFWMVVGAGLMFAALYCLRKEHR